MTGTPNPRIVEHTTIRADVDLGQLARALLVLEAGIRYRDGQAKQSTPSNGAA